MGNKSNHIEDIIDVSTLSALALPTLKGYQYSLSLRQEGKAFIMPFPEDVSMIRRSDGRLYDADGREIPTMEVDVTKDDVKKLDMPFLLVIHTIWWAIFEKSGYAAPPAQIKLYVPALIRFMGVIANQNKANREIVIDKIMAFHKTLGRVREPQGDNKDGKVFPVLIFREFDPVTNTVIIESPYMEYVVKKMYEDAKFKNDKRRGAKEVLKLKPNHSYLLKPSIASERNKAAVEIVMNIVSLIERAGGVGAHITAGNLIEESPILRETLKNTPKTGNKNNVLQRAFGKAWELLRTQTWIFERYKNMEVPDIIPTYQTLTTTVLTFRHEGKGASGNTEDADKDEGAEPEEVGEV